MSIYSSEGSNVLEQTELPVYGIDRPGMVYREINQDDYVYEVKDHPGNVRATLQSTTQTLNYLATMEPEFRTQEASTFLNLDESIELDQAMNTTPISSGVTNPDHAVRLNAADSKLIGPAMTLRVQKGDEVDLSVYAKYLDAAQSSTSTAAILPALASVENPAKWVLVDIM